MMELEPEKFLFVPENLTDGKKMVLFDLHEVNLSTFGYAEASEIAFGA